MKILRHKQQNKICPGNCSLTNGDVSSRDYNSANCCWPGISEGEGGGQQRLDLQVDLEKKKIVKVISKLFSLFGGFYFCNCFRGQ